jgi:hypothetical protein
MNAGIYSTGSVITMKCGASAVVKGKSGRFVQANDSGYIAQIAGTTLDIIGWVVGSFDATAAATAGDTSWAVETNIFGKLFVMPACHGTGTTATEAQLRAAIGESIDIILESTYYQYATTAASTYDIIIPYGYIYEKAGYGHQFLIVKPNPDKVAYATH